VAPAEHPADAVTPHAAPAPAPAAGPAPAAATAAGQPGSRPSRADALLLAQALFLRCERVDVQRIAKDLGVGRTTLYRWIGDREQLLSAVIGDLTDLAWGLAERETGGAGIAGLLATVQRFAVLTSTHRPARHFARTEPGMALRVLLAPEGRIRSGMRARVAQALAAHAKPGSYAPETPDLLVEIGIALVWTPITIGEEPDLERLARLLEALSPPDRA
jgi:AcrR family transcriptional regulator